MSRLNEAIGILEEFVYHPDNEFILDEHRIALIKLGLAVYQFESKY